MNREHCPSCGEDQWRKQQELRQTYTISSCRRCGILRSEGTPPEGTGEDEFGALDLDSYFKSLEALRRQSASEMLQKVERHRAPGDLLDIGCSFGWFLDVAKDRGWNTFGIEPSDVAVQHLTERTSHLVQHGVFPTVSFKERRFDAVVMTDVLEHIADPAAILRQVSGTLNPGGVVALRCPNQEGLIYKTAALLSKTSRGALDSPMWRMWQLDFPYPHLWYFSPATLASVLRRAEYDVLEVQTEPVIRVGGVRERVRYTAGQGSSPLHTLFLSLGLGACAVAAQALRMHDECYVIARVRDTGSNTTNGLTRSGQATNHV